MKRLKFYLCGPIQYVEDFITWREEISDFLEEMGHTAQWPWGEVYHGKKIKEIFMEWQKTMSTDKWLKEIRTFVRRKVIRYDLEAVLSSDGLIFYLPKGKKTAGSYGELTLAYFLKVWKKTAEGKSYAKGKRIFAIIEDLDNISFWAVGCADRTFSSLEEFKEYFKENFNRRRRRK